MIARPDPPCLLKEFFSLIIVHAQDLEGRAMEREDKSKVNFRSKRTDVGFCVLTV
jgi:hypothetical protein